MKILVDENMPFSHTLFSGFGEVIPVPGRHITPEMLVDIDMLLVRSVTKVDRALLAQANKLQFVGSATIGTDHLDIDYLSEQGIAYASAPGCNRFAVAEYVLSSMLTVSMHHQFSLTDKTVAIIGAGNTGSAVEAKLRAIGITPQLCDPLLEQQGDKRRFVNLDTALSADIICLHVPITTTGDHPTWHLLNASRLAALSGDQLLINACRGPVIDNQALLALKQQGKGPICVLDVWETEPDFDAALLPYIDIATPHIAGYSYEGKARGSWQLYGAICQLLSIAPEIEFDQLLKAPEIRSTTICGSANMAIWQQLLPLVYSVALDDAMFRKHCVKSGRGSATDFDHLRKTYRQRRECSSLQVVIDSPINDQLFTMLEAFGFNIKKG